MVAIYRLLGLLGFVSFTIGNQIPTRDYDSKNYFIVELNTSASTQPLQEFVAKHKGNYHLEHELQGLAHHYIFSIDKNHPHNEFWVIWTQTDIPWWKDHKATKNTTIIS